MKFPFFFSTRIPGWLKAGIVAGLLTAGALTAQEPPRNTPPALPGTATPPPTATPGNPREVVGQAVDPNKYQIGAEDVLFVRVWREPDFTMPVAVRPDGKITMPLIGDVQAAGMTPSQLTKALTDKLTTYINRPEVTVSVQDVRSQRYYIDGEVNRPGWFPLVTPTRVLEALSNAGGFREFANTKNITILRGTKTFKFNYRRVSKGKEMDQNIFLENGDHIIVR